MKRILLLLLSCCCGLVLRAQETGAGESWQLDLRLGYSLGGTTPIGLPASIRSLDKFTLQPNVQVGADVQRDLWGRWGLTAGLRFEGKHMQTDATVRGYYTEMVRGGQSLDGHFTGHVHTRVRQWMLTVPLALTMRAGSRVTLHAGPYVSWLLSRDFSGYAYDGYLRVGDPTGAKVLMGSEPDSRGEYEFGDDMRRLQLGLDAGLTCNVTPAWGAYASLAWGLTGIHRSGFTSVRQTMYPIYGTVGLTYRLRHK